MTNQISPEMQRCIEACRECHEVCMMTINHCLSMGGDHTQPAHMKLMMDCTQICGLSTDFMIRMSDHAAHVCRECAEICMKCAEDCERVGGNGDEQMKACSETCRTCADACMRMSGASVMN